MFARGPLPGAIPKEEALKLLPAGTVCKRISAMGMTGYHVVLPNGKQIAAAGTPGQAWRQAQDWAYRNMPADGSGGTVTLGRWREPNPHIIPTAKLRWLAPSRTGLQTWVGLIDDRQVATIKRQPGHEGTSCTALVDGWIWELPASSNALNVRENVARAFESIAAAKRAIAEAIRQHPAHLPEI